MTGALSAFHFERPLWLLLVVPAVALFLLERSISDATARWRRVVDPDLLKYLLVGEGSRSRRGPNELLLAAWALAVIAVAGPAWEREPAPFANAKPPVLVVLKVTPSMTTADLAPTRLDRARQKLVDLVGAREGAATGLVAYSGSSHLVLPPTPDGDVVLNLAGALSPRIMPEEGDDLAGAVALADRVLSGNASGGSILVMADHAAGDQIGRLSAARRTHPITMLALLPPGQDADSLADAARATGASLVATTVDGADVDAMARQIDRADRLADAPGEGQHWKEAGYWLTPLLALIALLWFRRGWVLA